MSNLKKKICESPKVKTTIDKKSPFHFIFGLLFGILSMIWFSYLSNFYDVTSKIELLIAIFSLLLIVPLEYIFHRIVCGTKRIIPKNYSANAISDLLLAFIGSVFGILTMYLFLI